MKNSLTKFTYSSLLLSALFLNIGCSALEEESTGSGLSNTTNTDLDINTIASATIDGDPTTGNIENLATAGAASLLQAVENKQSSGFLGAKVDNNDPVQIVTVAAAQQIAASPSAAEIPDVCDSGSIDIDTQAKILTMSSCVLNLGTADQVTLDGSAVITTSETGELLITTYAFVDFTVTVGSDAPLTLNLITVCENNKNTATLSCSYKSKSTGIDGREYISLTSDISGDASTGYFVTATVNDPVHGNVDVTTTNAVTFNCPNLNQERPDSGTITITGESNEMRVDFDNCGSYTVTFNGVGTTLFW